MATKELAPVVRLLLLCHLKERGEAIRNQRNSTTDFTDGTDNQIREGPIRVIREIRG
jgi:hypothetical protein